MAAKVKKNSKKRPHFTFIWSIENASALSFFGVLSPEFRVYPIQDCLQLKCYFDEGEIYIDIHSNGFELDDSIETELEISILCNEESFLMTKLDFFSIACYRIDFQSMRDIFFESGNPFFNDTLTIRCRIWSLETKIPNPDICFARTQCDINRCSFIWPIRDFSKLQPGHKRTHYEKSTSNAFPELIFNLFLSELNGKIFINVEIEQTFAKRAANVVCKLFLFDNHGKVVHAEEQKCLIVTDDEEVCAFENFLEKDELLNGKNSLLRNDILFLKCEIIFDADARFSYIDYYESSNTKQVQSVSTKMLEMPFGVSNESCTANCSFKKAFEDMFEDDSFCDIILRVSETSLPAHKAVLGVYSPVFKAMFTHDMREKTSKMVNIDSFTPDTIKCFLLYIYKGIIQDLQWENAMDLFKAADHYQVLDLREKCSLLLKSNLSMANVCSILLLADMHKEDCLKKAAESFISDHDVEVFKSDEWKIFKENNLRLALEITERIVINRRNN